MKIRGTILFLLCLFNLKGTAQDTTFIIKPARVFDGVAMHPGWEVAYRGNKIIYAGSGTFNQLVGPTKRIEVPNTTLLPGLIEGHSHLFLHAYNEVSWNDQVLKESRAERTARAVSHARKTLLAGFTTVRDLGTEGAAYDDAGLKKAIEKGIVTGPRMLVATRAIVATGTYGPKPETAELDLPGGAAEVGNQDELVKEARIQMSKGADLIKVYADYGSGRGGEAMPTFTTAELKAVVEVVKSSGRQVVVHAGTKEGMLRSIAAGVNTIEHGDGGDLEVFKLMKANHIALCPTLAAGESIASYNGWKKGMDQDPARVIKKKKAFQLALQSGVTICMGGDVGVFNHGNNALEMELMVEYGMKPLEVLRAATSVNADTFGIGNEVGRIKEGLMADMIIVADNPETDITKIRNIGLVIKNGISYKP
ncbi:metal-dependent hydrolase family protein [Pedobacter duraquae]|uniref:Imidazolonepropionase-like amidohydrolase n=1 Tax=Pedobacter duraquae TaxID=425511 RepID=A0A4R6IBJ5_9SPHI|nr:amidohydrolase family protein [Pedobacter duraquae]TDO19573.1 imidazolonepropionase-like amidohydrolase [Pedobacter duraquae]